MTKEEREKKLGWLWNQYKNTETNPARWLLEEVRRLDDIVSTSFHPCDFERRVAEEVAKKTSSLELQNRNLRADIAFLTDEAPDHQEKLSEWRKLMDTDPDDMTDEDRERLEALTDHFMAYSPSPDIADKWIEVRERVKELEAKLEPKHPRSDSRVQGIERFVSENSYATKFDDLMVDIGADDVLYLTSLIEILERDNEELLAQVPPREEVEARKDEFGNRWFSVNGKEYVVNYAYGRIFLMMDGEEMNPILKEDAINLSRCFAKIGAEA